MGSGSGVGFVLKASGWLQNKKALPDSNGFGDWRGLRLLSAMRVKRCRNRSFASKQNMCTKERVLIELNFNALFIVNDSGDIVR